MGYEVLREVAANYYFLRDALIHFLKRITVEANSFRMIDLGELAASGGAVFREGSVQLFHRGRDLLLGAQIYLVDAEHSLSFDEKLAEIGNFGSTRLEGIWWMPSHTSEVNLVLSNTSDDPLSVTARLAGNKHCQSDPRTLNLSPHETRLLDVRRDFKDDRQYVLTVKYAKAALEKEDQLPLEAEIRLARFLQGGPEYTTGQIKAEEWAQDRSECVTRWLHAWQRLEKEINRNFDFNNRPPLNVLPPPGHGPAGIAPESIKDAQARAEYESAIAANKERIAEYNKQWQLRQLDNYFTPYASQFIIEAYSKEPHNLTELKKYLDDYLTKEDLKEKIIKEVKKKMTE